MREIQYKTFSLRTHKRSWRIKKINVCQFELTFGCGLHCKHCYSDCYNKPAYLKKELTTREVKFILDKTHQAGVIWLCFTGGDPLTRKDFLDLYAYAKDKGFIITIFTNGYSMTKEIAAYLKERPPFVIEMTLNAAEKETFEKISQVKDSFEKVKAGIDLILKAKLPLKIKTQITQDNLKAADKIKDFIEGLGLLFRPAFELHARLDGDLVPCSLRIPPEKILGLNGNDKRLSVCDGWLSQEPENRDPRPENREPRTENRKPQSNLFSCAIGGGDGIQVDPYGNIFACNLIRKPSFNLLEVGIDDARNKLLALVRNRKFATNSKCNSCNLRDNCHWCPGKAYVEKGNAEASIEYYCKLTTLTTKK
jgi:radical SAM protein with 4Fe4S-binding SPASM domain